MLAVVRDKDKQAKSLKKDSFTLEISIWKIKQLKRLLVLVDFKKIKVEYWFLKNRNYK